MADLKIGAIRPTAIYYGSLTVDRVYIGSTLVWPLGTIMPAGLGVYSLTGIDALFSRDLIVVAGSGVYTLTGQDATLTVDIRLQAEAGVYTLTGVDANLLRAILLEAAAGSYVLTGQDVDFSVGRKLIAGAGTYQINGVAARLLRQLKMAAAAGTYALTGQDATLNIPASAPVVAARLAANNGSGTGSPSITLSGLSPASGNLLVVAVYNRDGRSYTWPAGWDELFDSSGLSVGYRTSDGAETSVTPTQSGTSRSAWVAFRITGWAGTPEAGTTATGTGNPDPPSISPSWGASPPTLFLAIGASEATSDITAGPGGDYSQFQTSRASNDPSCASAEFRGAAASSDPGAFTVSGSSTAAANTIAIKGA